MKYSCKATPRDEKQLMKKWIQDNFSLSCTSVVKMHWKPDRNYANLVRLSRFRTFVFFAKIKTLWNFWILFLKTVHQKGLLEQIKKKFNCCFCRRIFKNYWQPLLRNKQRVTVYKLRNIWNCNNKTRFSMLFYLLWNDTHTTRYLPSENSLTPFIFTVLLFNTATSCNGVRNEQLFA